MLTPTTAGDGHTVDGERLRARGAGHLHTAPSRGDRFGGSNSPQRSTRLRCYARYSLRAARSAAAFPDESKVVEPHGPGLVPTLSIPNPRWRRACATCRAKIRPRETTPITSDSSNSNSANHNAEWMTSSRTWLGATARTPLTRSHWTPHERRRRFDRSPPRNASVPQLRRWPAPARRMPSTIGDGDDAN